MPDIATVDTFLSHNGQFCLLDWLLAENVLPYAAYEAWRYGQVTYLDNDFSMPQHALIELAERAEASCRQLKLQSEAQGFYRWDGHQQSTLSVSENSDLHAALCLRWFSPQDAPQMDLFMDNSATIAENQLQQQLVARQFADAQESLLRLTNLNSSHARLGAYQDLVNYGMHMVDNPIIPTESVSAEQHGLIREVLPLADELLGVRKRDFLAMAWRRLADNLKAHAFDPDEPDLHQSFALLQIPDWQALRSSLEDEPQLYQAPHLMARLASAYSHHQQVGPCQLMWGLLFERFPDAGEALIGQYGGLLVEPWEGFLEYDEDWSPVLFLAYLLIRQPGLLHWLGTLPQQSDGGILNAVNQVTADLIQARLVEENEKPYREALQAECPAMLRCYLNKRDWYRSAKALR